MSVGRGLLGAIAGTSLVLACAPPGEEPSSEDAADTTLAVADGTVEALALFAFLDDPLTDAAALKAGGATKTAAKALLAHRAGADTVFGTADDDPYGSIGEVDAVPGVGPATIGKLAARARLLGYARERGEYHGVYLTENQADRVLVLVNEASLAELDDDAHLDRRAAQNIVDARPITSVAGLASIPRVKGTAMRLLRDHADRTLGSPTCGMGEACPAGLWCTGGAESFGRCVDTSVDGAGELCSFAGTCAQGLVCAGRSEGFEGICNPAWMKDEFVSESSGSIPDGPGGSTGEGVEVFGLATVPTDAVVRVVIDHARPTDLELSLTNPAGTTVLVWPRGAGPLPESIPVAVPGDESVNGSWVLTVLDTVAGQTGTSRRFSLELVSRFD